MTYRARLSMVLDDRLDLPNIADVQFPSMIGAVPSKPVATPPPPKKKKKRKPYLYQGVRLSRVPMAFEVKVLSLAEIPLRLDAAVRSALEGDLAGQIQEMAAYGAHEVLRELVRQGAPDELATMTVPLDVEPLVTQLTSDRDREIYSLQSVIEDKLKRRRLTGARLTEWTRELMDRRTPAMTKRYANRAVNEAFAFGRATAIDLFRRRHEDEPTISLAYRDETGKFISIADAVAGGDILVDAVVQTAVMDEYTCDPCGEVDGEVMDFGDARQLELHPPYVKCFGNEKCRCVQIALLSNGDEIEVDEIEEDTID